MVYDGEIINSVVSMQGDRAVPTAWIVKWKKED
jgi:exopolysaccharide biosynthesis protein